MTANNINVSFRYCNVGNLVNGISGTCKFDFQFCNVKTVTGDGFTTVSALGVTSQILSIGTIGPLQSVANVMLDSCFYIGPTFGQTTVSLLRLRNCVYGSNAGTTAVNGILTAVETTFQGGQSAFNGFTQAFFDDISLASFQEASGTIVGAVVQSLEEAPLHNYGSSSGTVAINILANGNTQKVTVTGNTVLAITPGVIGGSVLEVVQGAGGNFNPSLTGVTWTGNMLPGWTPTPGGTDIVSLYYDGVTMFASMINTSNSAGFVSDWYVNASTGSDLNDGKSFATQFATVEKLSQTLCPDGTVVIIHQNVTIHIGYDASGNPSAPATYGTLYLPFQVAEPLSNLTFTINCAFTSTTGTLTSVVDTTISTQGRITVSGTTLTNRCRIRSISGAQSGAYTYGIGPVNSVTDSFIKSWYPISDPLNAVNVANGTLIAVDTLLVTINHLYISPISRSGTAGIGQVITTINDVILPNGANLPYPQGSTGFLLKGCKFTGTSSGRINGNVRALNCQFAGIAAFSGLGYGYNGEFVLAGCVFSVATIQIGIYSLIDNVANAYDQSSIDVGIAGAFSLFGTSSIREWSNGAGLTAITLRRGAIFSADGGRQFGFGTPYDVGFNIESNCQATTASAAIIGIPATIQLNMSGHHLSYSDIPIAFPRAGCVFSINPDPTATSGSSGTIIVPTVTALKAFDATTLVDGQELSVKDFDDFRYNQNPISASFSDDVNIAIPHNGPVGAIYERLFHKPAGQQLYTTIFVNDITGNDSNPIGSAGTSLATLQEAFNRIRMLTISQRANIVIVMGGTSEQSFDCNLTGWEDTTHTCTITILGNPNTLATQTISSAVTPDPGTNVRGSITLPAAAYAVGEPVQIGTSLAWVTKHPSANIDNVTHFIGKNGVVADPVGGETLKHISLPSTIGNCTIRVPAGFHFQIVNCTINGEISVLASPNQADFPATGDSTLGGVVINQCKLPHGYKGTGNTTYVNCHIHGTAAPGVQPTEALFVHCTFDATLNITSSNIQLNGSTTFYGNSIINILNSQIAMQVANTLEDLSFWDTVAASCIIIQNGLMGLGSGIVWGLVTAVTQILEVRTGLITYNSAALPKTAGASNDYKIGSTGARLGSFIQLPVMCPNIPAGIVLENSSSGTAGVDSYAIRSTTLALTNIFPVLPQKGLYKVALYLAVITPTAGPGSLIGAISWTDDSGIPTSENVASVTPAAAGGNGIEILIECDGVNNPQYSILGTAPASYSARLTASKISSGS